MRVREQESEEERERESARERHTDRWREGKWEGAVQGD